MYELVEADGTTHRIGPGCSDAQPDHCFRHFEYLGWKQVIEEVAAGRRTFERVMAEEATVRMQQRPGW